MTVSCPDCRSVFRIDPAKVPTGGVRARCSVCGGIISVVVSSTTHTPVVQSSSIPATAMNSATPRAATPALPPAVAVATGIGMRTPVSASAPLSSSGQRRAINPFLKADPDQRAGRLARALVSDLVAYHPAKRQEGLASGTLRQLFRDEIKKSYEEYVEQVGREVAESTPHFQNALNDILADGQKIF